ncbi:protein CHLOROPLAST VESICULATION-like [Miscanthus floridulus]|uniref:protein CHLOROPLAST VESICULATION-like n=1 Tax=Miscanthus floridulus TaxID=154761 RepID=UPI0034599DA0
MAVSSISCSLRPPAPVREASARLTTQPSPPKTTTPWADGLRRACVAATAAACVVIGAAGGGDVAASTTPRDAAVVVAPRWSDRRECPPWRANSLENIVPENLPRPSARRRFNSVKRAPRKAPALGPQAVAPFLALPYGVDDCFTL